MKPDVGSYRSAWPEIDGRLIREHVTRLGEAYFETFREQEVYRHLLCLGRLTPEHPVEALLQRMEGDRVECTILAFDYPAEFSLITGLLAGMGMNILSGDVFTYGKATGGEPTGGGIREADPFRRRRIIDRFVGTLEAGILFQVWEKLFSGELKSVIGLLERGDESAEKAAKERVNVMVTRRLARLQVRTRDLLYPMQIEIDNSAPTATRLRVVSEDAPAFLYAFSTSLSLQNILIEHVRIRTIHGKIEDSIDLVDGSGRKIEEQDVLDRLKLAVLLTKQFTYFLGKAPDPISALSRFEHLLREIFQQPGKGRWIELLTSPETLQSLARLLGASDFLWEDFIRLQYETLLPMLHQRESQAGELEATLDERMAEALEGAASFEEQRERLNEFKDREIYLIDLEHILDPEVDFRAFAEKLTVLAEKVVRTSTELVYRHLAGRFGIPTTIGGLEARFAVMGLGKLGGAALGYASDIELLFVYSDSGMTNGVSPIDNAEFFDRLVREVIGFIRAKREGIFHVDVRLRPFGNAGPLASSLETFCSYYGREGQAHSYERLALVRMRAIGGDRGLGRQLERLRDEMVYSSGSIDLHQLKEIREKQVLENTRGARHHNAKFSKGGLVDLEYGVQILQVLHGGRFPEIRTPRIHRALNAFHGVEILSPEEVLRLSRAYDFLRRLINGLRMLRGSARDLFLPDPESEEFAYLARRMGYERGPLGPAGQLRMDFETHTAAVRVFAERYFGPEASPGKGAGTVVDLVLSDGPAQAGANRILESAGFRDPARAMINLRDLAGDGSRRNAFARLSLLALDVIGRVPDPDMALNNWERLVRAQGSAEFQYNLLLSQPMRLEILLSVLAGSQFLSDTLIRNPVFLDWVMIPEILHRERKREEMEGDLRDLAQWASTQGEWLNRMRRFRRREILRIGTRDMCLSASPEVVMLELTSLAEATVSAALDRIWRKLDIDHSEKREGPVERFCVLAFGKLGGRELNYSSDIDLLGILDDGPGSPSGSEEDRELVTRVMESLRADLTTHTEEGYAYRVDLRLRPFGRSGELVPTLSGLSRYYRETAGLWEIQALLKIRPIAGNLALGHRFLGAIRPMLLERRERDQIIGSIETMRNRAIQGTLKPGAPMDVKSGIGGLRDVEFMVQALQLMHAPGNPSLLEGNTLQALDLLGEARVLAHPLVHQLKRDYLFLRRVEHCLQILDDRQIHALPREPQEVAALAKRVMGSGSGPEHFMTELTDCLARVRSAYHRTLGIEH
jgi:[glutamine synthetase] adenylyltransferase / [glutamine synthetase]-adenylyl-L-tyrosine phosphorylase